MHKCLIILTAGLIFTSCSSKEDDGNHASLLPPSDVKVERTSADQVLVTWKDNSVSETGYAIMVRRADEPKSEEVAQVPADETSCTLTDILQEGVKYFVGVKAFNKTEPCDLSSLRDAGAR